MAAAKMRHFNSPEELAKRQGQPEAAQYRGQGFRHYNHPEEVAKRAGKSASAVVAPSSKPQRRALFEPEGWPPAGDENTAMVRVDSEPPARRQQSFPGEAVERLESLESLLLSLVGDEAEAREFRMHMSNIGAVVDAQRKLINKVRALEDTVEQLVDAANAEPPARDVVPTVGPPLGSAGDAEPPASDAGTPPAPESPT
jgi:hypothetical protein